MHPAYANNPVYIVRTRDNLFSRRLRARSERDAISKVARKHGDADYLAYQF
jgi:hypothetical protein